MLSIFVHLTKDIKAYYCKYFESCGLKIQVYVWYAVQFQTPYYKAWQQIYYDPCHEELRMPKCAYYIKVLLKAFVLGNMYMSKQEASARLYRHRTIHTRKST